MPHGRRTAWAARDAWCGPSWPVRRLWCHPLARDLRRRIAQCWARRVTRRCSTARWPAENGTRPAPSSVRARRRVLISFPSNILCRNASRALRELQCSDWPIRAVWRWVRSTACDGRAWARWRLCHRARRGAFLILRQCLCPTTELPASFFAIRLRTSRRDRSSLIATSRGNTSSLRSA